MTDVQAEAILNMRLRSLRRLEEMEIRNEHDKLSKEQNALQGLLADEGKRWKSLTKEVETIRTKFGGETELGRRRTELGEAPTGIVVPLEAFIEREAITVVLSEKGWIRAIKGHSDQPEDFKFKEGDSLYASLKAETTDKILIFASDGRFFTLGGDKIPRGRGHGEPLRLMVDLANDAEVVSMFVHRPGRKLLLASLSGRGFLAEEAELLAQTKAGRMVMSVDAPDKAAFCLPMVGDAVAIMGDNRKLLVFKADEIPVMSRGRGVMLQKYRDGGVADITVFQLDQGLSWRLGERERTEKDLLPWLGKRASIGRLPPTGFPRSNKFR